MSIQRYYWIASSLLVLLTMMLLMLVLLTRPRDPHSTGYQANSSHSLLKEATYITALETDRYLWYSANALLLQKRRSAGRQEPPYAVVQFDYVTGKTTPLSTLRQDWQSRKNGNIGGISQDGKWILMRNSTAGKPYFEALELNGKRVKSSIPTIGSNPLYGISNPVWTPDGQGWVYLGLNTQSGEAGLCAIQWSLNPQKIEVGPPFGYPKGTTLFPSTIGSRLLGFTKGGSVLAVPLNSLSLSDRERAILLYEFHTGRSPHLREFSLPIHQGETALDIALSPDGDRLAVIVRRSPSLVEFYTIGVNGRDKCVLGTLPLDQAIKDNPSDYSVYQLSWLPDGKRLSFVHKQALWTFAPR